MNTLGSNNLNLKNHEDKEPDCIEQATVLPNLSFNNGLADHDDVNTRIIVSLTSEKLGCYVLGYN
ncbi:MAG: hypothetical protein ABJH06_09775 [Paraglaciecola sp.]|uniref:hypothetical protein n=1 Tax=Paraglaciecola sp. TaxID=1920173 RepID=UPI0032992516